MSREGSSTEGSPSGQACEQDESERSSLPRAALRAGRCFCRTVYTRVHAHTVLCDRATASIEHREDLSQRASPACRSSPTRLKGSRKPGPGTRGRARSHACPLTLSHGCPDTTHTHHPGGTSLPVPPPGITSGTGPACAGFLSAHVWEGEWLRASGESRGGFPTSGRVFPLNPGTPTPRAGQPPPTAASGSPSPHGNSVFRSVLEEPVY